MPLPTPHGAYIRWFAELGLDDIPLVGGKNASLGEMYRALSATGVNVPPGFAITADAYRAFLHEAQLDQTITTALTGSQYPRYRGAPPARSAGPPGHDGRPLAGGPRSGHSRGL